jgi:hypothetical protein
MALTINSLTGITWPDGTVSYQDPLSDVAAAGVGALGTYAMCKNITGTQVVAGGTLAGSSLYYSNAVGTSWYCYSGVSPPGSWRCMGYTRSSGNPDAVSIFLRYV